MDCPAACNPDIDGVDGVMSCEMWDTMYGVDTSACDYMGVHLAGVGCVCTACECERAGGDGSSSGSSGSSGLSTLTELLAYLLSVGGASFLSIAAYVYRTYCRHVRGVNSVTRLRSLDIQVV